MRSLGERLRSLRTRKKIMAKSIAELLQVSPRNYQRYERDEVDMPTSKLAILADYYNMSTDYLLGRTDNPAINL